MVNIDPRRSLARLAAAVMAADARVTTSEIAAVSELVRLGLGTLETATREELALAAKDPIDVDAACAALLAVYPEGGETILAALADIAASDGELDPREIALLGRIGDALGVVPSVVAHVVRSAAAAAGASVLREVRAQGERPRTPKDEPAAVPAVSTTEAPPSSVVSGAVSEASLAAAYAVLGLEPGTAAAAVEDAYRAVIERYQPVKVLDLGPEFAVLAVRRLATATAAYVAINEAGAARS